MGSDQSRLKGLEIDEKAVEVTDYFSLYNAEIPKESETTMLSIFQSEFAVIPPPLERATKNLMIFRHPNILKYITSWEKGSQRFLVTERCRPLSLVLPTQTDIQVCLGIKNILSGLIFLVENAKARHLNLCISSIYVVPDGAWRLSGFEHVWKSKDVTLNLLDKAKLGRYPKAIDVNEAKVEGLCIEQFAFAVMCEEILRNSKGEGTPYVTEFREYCATHLKHQNVAMRPKLSAILLHPYFNHEFVLIHSFLMELPLKSPQEKQDFFTGLIDRLRYFDETVVAAQLGGLLLSRLVLLDVTAQLCVTPYVLRTKTDISAALFTNQNFMRFIIPKIKQIFNVRDAQIRLILLEYFNEYVNLFTKEELQEQILPNLLLGIKDTNDILVAKTLRCLADLVPLLGSAVVIGGNRRRLFADGRPQGLPDSTSHWVEPRSITPVMTSGDYILSASPLPDTVDISESYLSVGGTTENLFMPERLSPDGGEDIRAATDGELDEDAWSDWENDETRIPGDENDTLSIELSEELPDNQQLQLLQHIDNSQTTSMVDSQQSAKIMTPDSQSQQGDRKLSDPRPTVRFIEDINELDIKNKTFTATSPAVVEEIDFFKDMEPVIETTKSQLIVTPVCNTEQPEATRTEDVGTSLTEVSVDESRFKFKIEDDMAEAGWDDGTNDW